jgi:hypothetical protein
MATCREGMAFDLAAAGHTHITALNPATESGLVDALAEGLNLEGLI